MAKPVDKKETIVIVKGKRKGIASPIKTFIKKIMPFGRIIQAKDINEGINLFPKDHPGLIITDTDSFSNILNKIKLEEKTDSCMDTKEQLKACQQRYQELLNNMKIGVVIYETPDNGETFYVKDFNKGAEFIEKVKGSEIIGKKIDEVFPGVHQFGLTEVIKRVYKTGSPEHHPIGLYSDERIKGWRDNYVYRLPSGEVVTIYTDETDRKQAEQALQKSEERYRNIFENISEGIFQTTPEGRYILVNTALARMYGFKTPEDMINTIKDIKHHYINPSDRDRFKRLIESHGYVKGFEANQYHRNGSIIWISINAHVVRDEKGNILYYEGTAKDITMRKKAQKELLEQQEQLRALSMRLVELEETERRRISQELHDSVGQNLTALSINLNIIASQLKDLAQDTITSRLNDSLVILEQTTEKIRDVMSDLRPSVLDDYGLLAGLRWYGRLFSSRTGINVWIHGEDLAERPGISIENALFRISQEALTNIAKHSGATEVNIHLHMNNGILQLSIEDNGRGFDMEDVMHYNKSVREKRAKWGLTTMKERALSVRGNIQIESQKGKGTKVIVSVPI